MKRITILGLIALLALFVIAALPPWWGEPGEVSPWMERPTATDAPYIVPITQPEQTDTSEPQAVRNTIDDYHPRGGIDMPPINDGYPPPPVDPGIDDGYPAP